MNSEDLELKIFHRQLVPEYNKRGAKCSGVCFGFQEDNAALVRIGTAKESLYTSLVVLAHEFRHAFQLLKQQRWGGDEVELECDAISFGYEVAAIYCEKTFILGEI